MLLGSQGFEITWLRGTSRESCNIDSLKHLACCSIKSCNFPPCGIVTAGSTKYSGVIITTINSRLQYRKNVYVLNSLGTPTRPDRLGLSSPMNPNCLFFILVVNRPLTIIFTMLFCFDLFSIPTFIGYICRPLCIWDRQWHSTSQQDLQELIPKITKFQLLTHFQLIFHQLSCKLIRLSFE